MIYTLSTGKTVRIPDAEIEKSMKILSLTKEEAIQLWLEDNDYEINEEQVALCEKAKEIKVATLIGAKGEPTKQKTQRERVKKDDPAKEMIIAEIAKFLPNIATDIQVVDDRKIITFKIGEDSYKLDLTRTRKPKT